MNRDEIIELLAQMTDRQPDELLGATTFDELGLDSFDRVEMLLTLEVEHQIILGNDDVAKLRNIEDLCTTIAHHLD